MDLRIYMASGFALLFSLMEEANVILQFIVLVLTIVYLLMNIKKRILEIAYKHKLGHLGSYLSAASIVDEIYENKDPDDIFILSL